MKKKGAQEIVDYSYPNELNPAFTSTLQRLIQSVTDILDDIKTKPLVDDAVNLEKTIEVCYGRCSWVFVTISCSSYMISRISRILWRSDVLVVRSTPLMLSVLAMKTVVFSQGGDDKNLVTECDST